MPKPWENKSGCKDPTAYEAIKNLEEESKRVSDFIRAVKILAGLCGFEIVSYIKIKVNKTGRTY
jgi:hypothetical protein